MTFFWQFLELWIFVKFCFSSPLALKITLFDSFCTSNFVKIRFSSSVALKITLYDNFVISSLLKTSISFIFGVRCDTFDNLFTPSLLKLHFSSTSVLKLKLCIWFICTILNKYMFSIYIFWSFLTDCILYIWPSSGSPRNLMDLLTNSVLLIFHVTSPNSNWLDFHTRQLV